MQVASCVCSSVEMVYYIQRKPYVIMVSVLLNHIIQKPKLTCLEKLYYLLADLYAHLNIDVYKRLRETEKSALQWANLLGCSEEYIFRMQKNLENAGYFQIIRKTDLDNQNEKNIIIPTLPDDVFKELDREPNRKGAEHLVVEQEPHQGYKRSHLDNSKLFISFNLQMIKRLLLDASLSSLQKLIWLYAFCRSYTSYIDSEGEGTRNFITTYQELALAFNCSEKTISTAINALTRNGYLAKKQFYIKKEGSTGRRKKKSCWELSALFPQEQMEALLKQPDRQNLAPLTADDLRLYGLDLPKTQPNTSLSHNSSVKLGGSSCSSEYNIKYNILNTKNNVTEISDTTNIVSNPNASNVFIENKLIASTEEIALGLSVAVKFEEKTLLNPREQEPKNLEETIKQVDLTLTNEEHWLVTKTAFTLHQKLQTEIQAQAANNAISNDVFLIKLKETLFTPIEERLVSLWESFSDLPHKAEQEEFLIRKSWVLKLLQQIKSTINLKLNLIQPKPTIMPKKEMDLPVLPGDKADKAQKFAKKLRTKGLAKGYAAEISADDLAREFMYHAATWVPERLQCSTHEAQIDAALSFAWKAVERGTWKCPYRLLSTQIAQREADAASWKN